MHHEDGPPTDEDWANWEGHSPTGLEGMTPEEIAWHQQQNAVAAALEMASVADQLAEMAMREAEREEWRRSREAEGLSPWP